MAESNMNNYYQQDNEAFRSKSVENWSGDDCFDWAIATSNSKFHPCSDSLLSVFKLVNGRELLSYNEEEFYTLADITSGPFFYENFQKILKQKNENIHSDTDAPSCTMLHNMHTPSDGELSAILCLDYRTVLDTSFDENSLLKPFGDFNALGDYSMVGNSTLDSSQPLDNSFEFLNISQDNYCDELSLDNLTLQDQVPVLNLSDLEHEISQIEMEKSYNGELEPEVHGSNDVLASEDDPVTSRHWFERNIPIVIGNGTVYRMRGPRSYEFILKLLQDSRTNGVLVKWEDKENGIFRLLQKETIAQMWGNRNGNSNRPFTYESFYKLLRNNKLMAVKPRQLMFRFGPELLRSI